MRTELVGLVILSMVLLVVIAPPAHAYLDPGTGSMILQGIIAALVGASVVLKVYWYKMKSFLRGRGTKPPAHEPLETERPKR